MIWFLVGLLSLFLLVSGLKWLARANRKQAGMAAAATLVALLLGLGLVLLLTGKLYPALTALGSAGAGLWRMRWLAGLLAGPVLRRQAEKAARGAGTDSVETARLRLDLDASGRPRDGLVLTGSFAGRSLSGLDFGEALALLDELESADPDGTRYLETYLDHSRGNDWRDRRRHYGQSGGKSGDDNAGNRRRGPQSGMSREEALQILGLAPDAGEADIKAAHRRLMKRVHPDQGGSGYFASKLNEAKDVLLGRNRRR